MAMPLPAPNPEDIQLFKELVDEFRYDFCKLAYIIWPFKQKGTELEGIEPYDWQMEEWEKISKHLSDPATRYQTYRLIVSSGNGAAKSAFGAMTIMMLMYTQQLRARLTANTDPQMKTVVWPEYDKWFRTARFHDYFFEKFGTSIKAKNEQLADTWRTDTVTWSAESPTGISGLHNKGRAVAYLFEEAPGIPAVVWDYTRGAFADADTIKFFIAFGNSDDPDSKFEQNMNSPLWNSRRIDCRDLPYMDKKAIEDILFECNGNEDHDEFRVRVRGLPRKTNKDSIIDGENVKAALERRKGFDVDSVGMLPAILGIDPAWTGGDETTIWYRQGNYAKLLEKYKLDKSAGETHQLTYAKACEWERKLRIDQVNVDQGEGTALYTLAMNAGKTNWILISFAGSPNDTPEFKDSQYANIRAQMYYEFDKFLREGGVLDAEKEEWIPEIQKQLSWTKGGRHRINNKKLAEAKLDIKKRIGQSPDIADGAVLTIAIPVTVRLPENDQSSGRDRFGIGDGALKMPDHPNPYDTLEADYEDLYD